MLINSLIADEFRLSEQQKKALKKLGLETVQDLLFYFPSRYSDISALKLIRDLVPGETATIYGKIISTKTRKGFRSKIPMGDAEVEDMSGKIKVIWFHQAYIAKMIHPGQSVKLTGRVSKGKHGLYLSNPEFEKSGEIPIDTHDSIFSAEGAAPAGGQAGKLAELEQYNGLLVPGGFGERGVEGKIAVIKTARENKIPYFGLCYGLQLAVIEYARHVAGLKKAHTTEVNPKTPAPVIDILPGQKENLHEHNMGGTMRLGAYPAVLKEGSLAAAVYGVGEISERHRHRYEINPDYVETLEKAGLVFSGRSPDGRLMEIMELPRATHPFFLGTQFHPEFKSTPLYPHPLFVAFLRAAAEKSKLKASSY